ncbi:hypothetical protein QMK19_12890 [Streptomyces sp. H10-C2]|uniref:hypothetical protein n=1 Tax=unclassified Streptomyces TaxID=2593676 RepID=UPI0024B87F74|nr:MULTISPECIES: hypothetical protein [unclassified Streptomyces]MDJ0342548.1 hypothetical protein [Streptomyces sp. PH10-H1]MDJ0370555.1 hypothetical protein [Streptomyces sp. H10-C2]
MDRVAERPHRPDPRRTLVLRGLRERPGRRAVDELPQNAQRQGAFLRGSQRPQHDGPRRPGRLGDGVDEFTLPAADRALDQHDPGMPCHASGQSRVQ